MTGKKIILVRLLTFLVIGGAIALVIYAPLNEAILAGLFAGIVIVLIYYFYHAYETHKRQISQLKGSISPGEKLAASGYVLEGTLGQKSAILVCGSGNRYRVHVTDSTGSQTVLTLAPDLVSGISQYDKKSYLEIRTDQGMIHFAPIEGFTILGQQQCAESILKEMIASGIPRMGSYTDIIEKIHKKITRQGIDTLSHVEQIIYAIDRLEKIVMKGGFSLFFRRLSTDFPLDPIDALDEFQAHNTANVLKKAKALIPDNILSDEKSIQKWLKRMDQETRDKLDQLEEEFHGDSDLRFALGEAYIRSNMNELLTGETLKRNA